MDGIKRRFARVLEQIEKSLDQPLDIAALARSAAYSKFHFQRQFSSLFGQTVADYRRLLLLKRAGQQLAFRSDLSVTEIAYDAGYQNLESFSRAFSRIFRQTPTQFRTGPNWAAWHEVYDPLIALKGQFMSVQTLDFDRIQVTEFPDTMVAALEHKGPQAGLTASAQAFIAWRKENGLPPAKNATFNILYDDPKSTPPAEFRFDFCCAVEGPVRDNGYGIVTKTIPGGLVAVLKHVGSLDFAEEAIRSLYRDWLPQSGRDLRDFPLFVKRLSFFPDVPEHEAKTEIYLPLK